LSCRGGDFNGASAAHVFPVVLILGATADAYLVRAPIGRLAWPEKLVGTAMQNTIKKTGHLVPQSDTMVHPARAPGKWHPRFASLNPASAGFLHEKAGLPNPAVLSLLVPKQL
jgi:hypothetical protein